MERLEARRLLAAEVPAPEAVDDSYVIDSQVSEPEYGVLPGTYFNVLDNDLTLANASQFASLEITKGPTGGQARVVEMGWEWYNHPGPTYEPFPDSLLALLGLRRASNFDNIDDEDSPVGDGHASAVWGVVDQYGQIRLKVSAHLDIGFGGITYLEPFGHPTFGDYALYVQLGVKDFTNFLPGRHDFEFRDTLRRGKADSYILSGQLPGTPFIAWIDNTVGTGRPDTIMLNAGPFAIHYTPDPGFVGTDTFRYALRDPQGVLSREATVTVTVRNRPPEAGGGTTTAPNTPVEVGWAHDLDGTIDPSSITVVSPPTHGRLERIQSEYGFFLYTPDPGFLGTDRFSFTVRDNRGALSNVAIAEIRVERFNIPPVTSDVLVSVRRDTPTTIDVLANVVDLDGLLDATTLTIERPPTHGRAVVRQTADGAVVLYTPDPGYLGPDQFGYTIRDTDGAKSSVATVIINPAPEAGDDAAETTEAVPVFIDVLANDNPSASGSRLAAATLTVTSPPGRGRVGLRQTPTGLQVVYTPAAGSADLLVVDNLSDTDDGNYGPGQLSLREAIKLANADRYTDTFTYTVKDKLGIVSNPAVVTVEVAPRPTTIRFSPRLTARGPATIRLSQTGDASEGNSALAIGSPVTIIGPTTRNRITLAGLGRESDLRLFLVTGDGELSLSNVTLTRSASDGDGGALYVAAGAVATLTNCVLTDNFAYRHGGAVAGFGDLILDNCTISENTAGWGGGIASFGSITLTNSRLLENEAEYGGGLYNALGRATLTGTLLERNVAGLNGGGLYNAGLARLTAGRFVGNQAHEGGGFFTTSDLQLINSIVSGNRADTGGGFANTDSVVLSQSSVSGNTARRGGGAYNIGLVTATSSPFSGNRANQGGAIFNSERADDAEGSSFSLTNSMIERNHAEQGGGVYVDLGMVSLVSGTIADNTASAQGGGLYNDGAVTLTRTTIGANTARTGGGVYNGFGGLTLRATTVSANSAQQGGGLYNNLGSVTLTSSIVAGNRTGARAGDIAGPTPILVAASSANLIGTGGSGGLRHGQQGNLVGVAPLLGALGDYGGSVRSFPLLPGSPAIDAGTGTEPDARGIAAVGARDIGAFESQGFRLSIQSGNRQSARTGRTFSRPLKVAVTAVNPQEPVIGGVVAFTAPDTGAAATFGTAQATIGRTKVAKVTATANARAGTYVATATAAGAVAPALFTLTNVGSPTAASASIPSSTVRAPVVSAPVTAPATQPPLTAPLDWSAGYAVLPADPTEYRLNNAGQLLRRPPGGTWTVLAEDVRSFQQGRNGDLYLLTEMGELKRFQLGYSWSTLQTGVQAFHIDPFGTVFVRDRLNTLIAHSATHEYYVLPAIPSGTEHFSQDPPLPFEPVHAAGIDAERSGGQGRWEWPYSYLLNDIQYFPADPDGFPLTNELVQLLTDAGRPVPDPIPGPANPPTREFDTSYFNNVRMVIEPIVDRVDSPRLFPGVGLAQLHHAEYKVTVYSVTLPAAATEFSYGRFWGQVDFVFISHDHLHLVEPVGSQAETVRPPAIVGGVPPSAPASIAGSRGTLSTSTPRILGQGLEAAQMMITAPDGTIYLPGRGQTDIPILGAEAAPYFLRKLTPNGLWKPLDFALNHAIGPDSRLYILDPNHELRTPALGPTKWATLATNVRAFVLDAEGTLFVLDQHGDLRRRTAGAADWTPAERGVASLMISPQGTVYSTTDRGELRRLNAAGRWTVLDQGLRGHAMVSDGAVYALNGRGELIRITDQGERKVLATGLQALQVAPDGGVHVLTDRQELRKLTARDHWTVLQTGVRRFQIATNGDLYLLTLQADLRRLKAGSSWETLQGNVRSFTIDTDGSVAAYDHRPMPTIYSSLGRHYVLSPGNPDAPGITEPPTELEVLFAAHLRTRFTIYDRNPENANEQVDRLDEASGRPLSGSEEYSPFAPILPALPDREQPQLRFTSVEYSAPVLTEVLDEIDTISTERVADHLEPVRFVPGLGPAQLHRAGFKSTITLTRVDGTSTRELIVFLDRDHYHLAGSSLELS